MKWNKKLNQRKRKNNKVKKLNHKISFPDNEGYQITEKEQITGTALFRFEL